MLNPTGHKQYEWTECFAHYYQLTAGQGNICNHCDQQLKCLNNASIKKQQLVSNSLV